MGKATEKDAKMKLSKQKESKYAVNKTYPSGFCEDKTPHMDMRGKDKG